jgi:hypothetical protein
MSAAAEHRAAAAEDVLVLKKYPETCKTEAGYNKKGERNCFLN